MRLSLRHIRYVVTVADTGSIAAASRACRIAQSSILAAIDFAEGEIGARIFDRRPARGVVITPAGERFLVSARAFIAAEAEFGRSLNGLQRDRPPNLRIGCFEPFGALVMPELLRRYMQDGAIDVTLREGEQPLLLDWLATGAVDLIVTYNIGPGLPQDAVPLARFPAHALLPAGDPLAGQASVSLAELAQRPLVLLDLPQTAGYLTALFQTEISQPRVVFRSRSYDAVRAAVGCGFGVSVLNMPPIGPGSPDSAAVLRRPLTGDLPAPTLVIADIYGAQKPGFIREFISVARAFFLEIGPANFAVALPERYPNLLPA